MGPAFAALLWSKKQTADPAASSDYELKLVQVLFRHGARTPLKSIPDVMEVRPSPFRSNRLLCAVQRPKKKKPPKKSPKKGDASEPVCLAPRPSGCQTSWILRHTPTSTMSSRILRAGPGLRLQWRTAIAKTL